MHVSRPSPIFILTPSNRENIHQTPKCTKIVRSTTPTAYHVPRLYISRTPNNQNQNQIFETNKHSFCNDRSTLSTEAVKSLSNFDNKSQINQKEIVFPEEEKTRLENEVNELKKENSQLIQKISNLETRSFLEKQKYEGKILGLKTELKFRSMPEKNTQRPGVKAQNVEMLEKLMEDMKKEHNFALETLKKDHKKSIEMYEMLLKEMESNINELLKKNGMLNLNLKEFERKNRELLQINKNLNKRNLELESQRLE